MDKIKYLFFLGLSGFFDAADALPIFSHTTNGAGFYTISADGTNEPTGLAGLNVDKVTGILYLPSTGRGPDRYRDNPLASTQVVTVIPYHMEQKGRHHSPFFRD